MLLIIEEEKIIDYYIAFPLLIQGEANKSYAHLL
jgi:hypothetical protein